MSLTTITSKGQITLPKHLREKLNLNKGDKLDCQPDENGAVMLIPLNKRVSDVFGILSNKCKKVVAIDEMDTLLNQAFLDQKI